MFFTLKKVIGGMLLPLPLLLSFMAAGLLSLAEKRQNPDINQLASAAVTQPATGGRSPVAAAGKPVSDLEP